MILHPGILALLGGSLVTLLIMVGAGWQAVRILLFWDITSSSEEQLRLERRTWLISTLVNYALGFQVFSAVLFVFTADDIHRLFVGAMCATGSLNANLVGWLVLLLKGFLLFAGGLWVLLNHLDQSTEDCPLVRPKYAALLVLTPLVGLDLYLQWRYFSGLQPAVITSCCGSLFSDQGESVAADLIALPVGQSMALLALAIGSYLLLLGACLRFQFGILRQLLFAAAVLMFFVSLGAVISFISLYIYQMPTHHCPFDMLQGHYGYIGYPLYGGLYLATLYGMLPGICQPLRKYPSLRREIDRRERHWLLTAALGLLMFLVLSCWQMAFGSLRLFGY